MTELSIDTERMAGAARGLNGVAAQLRFIVAALDTGIDGQHRPWGQDKIGREFAGEWVPPKNDLLTAGNDLARVLESAAEGMETMARGFAGTEDANVDSLRGATGADAGPAARGGLRTT
ncbi:hypothetical protein [Streptomyces sp. NPDC096068]|uniref:hypothetical protein n=1 Tax=Streptomyces sp. NPDC096068 TaxID=3155424 RepID=UPI003320A4D7